jgi:hypothetical protein
MDRNIFYIILILLLVLLPVVAYSDTIFTPDFGYDSTSYKAPALYGRKDYFNTVESINRDQLNNKSLTSCINKISTCHDNTALVNKLIEDNHYLKLQNEKLMNELIYNRTIK